MSRSFRYNPDDDEPVVKRKQDRTKRDARKGAFFTPPLVADTLRDAGRVTPVITSDE